MGYSASTLTASTPVETTAAETTGAAAKGQALHSAARVCALTLLLLGFSVLTGWMFGSEALKTVLPNHISMKPNTAVGFMAAALALSGVLWPSLRSRIRPRIFAGITGLIGVLSLAEYLFHVDLGIDNLFFPDTAQPYPGRMAHISAVSFCIAGVALFLVRGTRRARMVALVASLLLTSCAFVAVVGYLYGVPFLFGSAGYTSMALHTGLGFLVLGMGLILAQPRSKLLQVLCADEAGGWLARRMLPGVVLLPVALGWLYLRPAMNFGRLRFGMALFAVTLVAMGSATVWLVAFFLIRVERQRDEILRVREQSDAAVKQSERELRLVTDHLPTLLSYIDTEGRLLRVNRTYESWSGLSAEQIVGRTVRELLGEEYWRRTLPAREAALRGETTMVETTYPTLAGERLVQVTYAPDIDEEGEVRGFACMVADIDDHRQAEAALRRSEKLAVVGRLASSIAHEINNPLEAVTNLLYLAALETAGQGDEGAEANKYVTLAQQELARVTHIVVQTLRFHRQTTQPTLCHMSETIEQVLSLYQGRLANACIEVRERFRDDAPLLCYEGEVRQVLANLVGNAADAMSTGGRLTLRTRRATDGRTGRDGVLVTVADTGHGIAPETRERLFEPFHTTKDATGSGLGLWVSKEIIDRHGGVVRVRSSVAPHANGTVFHVFLPNLQRADGAAGGRAAGL